MAGKGGYQRPENPAMHSGPGALSQRTDGGPGRTMEQAARYISGRPYGEGKLLNANQLAAPMAGSGLPTDAQLESQQNFPTVKPLTENGNPNIPLTQGMPFGPGDNNIPGYSPVSLNFNPDTGVIEESDKTLDEVASDTKISKSTVFLAVKKVRRYLKDVIDNPDIPWSWNWLSRNKFNKC